MRELSFSDVARILRADFETGKLYWLPRTQDIFPVGKHAADHNCAKWNGKFAGKEALNTLVTGGYRGGGIFGKAYSAHRVIWLLHTGSFPLHHIDHINGDRSDNRISNLRAATRTENNRNRRIPNNNTSGAMGVIWSKQDQKWRAQIKVDGRKRHLGYFDNFADAVATRKLAEIKYGFHENHGRMA